MKCKMCGEEMVKTADHIWDCNVCGSRTFTSRTGKRTYEFNDYGYGDVYDDEDDEEYMPDGCIGCGNPFYPNCRSSCPLFDE